MSTTATGFICDWCKRSFGSFVSQYIIDGMTLCPICYRKEILQKDGMTND